MPAAGADVFGQVDPPGWLRAWGTVGGKIAPEAPRGIFGEILGTPPNLGEPRLKKTDPLVKSAAGFGPEIQFSHLSLAISLILSGVSQIEVSFGNTRIFSSYLCVFGGN